MNASKIEEVNCNCLVSFLSLRTTIQKQDLFAQEKRGNNLVWKKAKRSATKLKNPENN